MWNSRGAVILVFAGLAISPLTKAADAQCARAVPTPGIEAAAGPASNVFGKIIELNGAQMTIQTREGQPVTVDVTAALAAHQTTPLLLGRAVDVLGTVGPGGVVRADAIRHAKDSVAGWGVDCLPVP
jgi:hypothetical protein